MALPKNIEQLESINNANERKRLGISTERVSRKKDKLLRNNKCWDELNVLHFQLACLLRTHAAHSVAVRTKELMERIPNKDSFATLMKSLLKVVQYFGTKLQDIHNTHSNRKGGAKNHDDILESMQIYGKYTELTAEHEDLLMPISTLLSKLTSVAEQIMVKDGLTNEVDAFRIKMNEYINSTAFFNIIKTIKENKLEEIKAKKKKKKNIKPVMSENLGAA